MRVIDHLLQQVSVIGAHRHLGQNHDAEHVQRGHAGPLWARQGFSRGAGGRQPARSQVDHPVNRGPAIKGHRVAFPAGLLCSVGDLGRSVIQSADHRQ